MGDQAAEGVPVSVTRMDLRGGGWIGYSDDALFVDDGERVKVRQADVARLRLRTLEWDLAVMSLLLVGVGGYVVATRNPLVGVAFALVGGWSLYRTYRGRYALVIRVADRPKPLSVHPVEPTECYETLAARIDGLE
jgi:hypothetical protein